MRRKYRRKRFLITLLLLCGSISILICLRQYFKDGNEYTIIPAETLSANIEMERVWMSDVVAVNEFIAARYVTPTSNFFNYYAYNRRLSDKIGAYRALPETRDETCRARNYHLPHRRLKVSVIISFHNEARSMLMRTIMAVYRRTPTKYLHELILVDDSSEDASLLSTLRHLKVPPFARSTFKISRRNATATRRLKLNNGEGFLKEVAPWFNENAAEDEFNYNNNEKKDYEYQQNGDDGVGGVDDEGHGDFVVIKMQRNSRRLGLIESRNRGALLATGDYLFFLDSHCEVNVGWLEPLLERATASAVRGKKAANQHTTTAIAVSPVLDSIDAKTLQYRASSHQLMGGFDWNLHFHWIRRQRHQRNQHNRSSNTIAMDSIQAETFRSPVTSGGVFLISRKSFLDFGGFNTQLKIWGGESIEFSIKLWLCGGQVEIVPCSRVGHVFRKEHTFQFTNDNDDGHKTYLSNSKVIAEYWLDSYKHFFYALKPAARNLKINISKNELELFKHEKKCKSFAWYLSNVFPQLKLPNDDFIAFGKLSTSERCLHILQQQPLNQKWVVSSSKATTNAEKKKGKPHVRLQMANCYHTDVTHWYLNRHNGHLHSSSGACLNVIRISMPSSSSPTSLSSLTSSSLSSSSTFLNQTLYLDAVYATHFIVVLQYCHQTTPTTTNTKAQRWLRRGAQLIHEQTHLCLDNPLNDVVAVSHCRHEAPSQLFHFTMEMQQLWQL